MPIRITVEEVEYIVFKLVEKYAEWDEPIPKFSTRNPGILESCLEQPFQGFDFTDLYPTLIDKASILFYLMIKNHPFQNGNKRLAIFTLNLFLNNNLCFFDVEPMDLYKLSLDVANSDPAEKDKILNRIRITLLNNTTKFDPSAFDDEMR
jgi:death-on-curing protein